VAKLKGIIKFIGRIGDLSVYKTQDGYIVRKGWGPDKDRMRKDPAFKKARKHGKEWGACGKAGGLVTRAVKEFAGPAMDNRVTSRLNKAFFKVLKHGVVKAGKPRKVGDGMRMAAGQNELKGFEFNIKSSVRRLLKCNIETNEKTGVTNLRLKTAKGEIHFPRNATHAVLRSGWLKINFEKKTSELKVSKEITIAKNAENTAIKLKPVGKHTKAGWNLFLLKVGFKKEGPGGSLTLNDAKYNACCIVGVGK
jgi:hypothetical protein